MKVSLMCAMFFAALSVLARIDVRSTIDTVNLGGYRERCGVVQLEVSGDDFRDATPSNPIYIRMSFDKNTRLSETVVDYTGSEMGHHPIAIPVKLGEPNSSVINVPATGVTLVRWRKGEDSLWLKVTTSSSFWVTRGGVPGPPTPSEPVVITLGQTVAEATVYNQQDFNNDRVNLVAPMRVDGGPADIPHFLDLRDSTVRSFPAPLEQSFINIHLMALSSDTKGVENSAFDPLLGSALFVLITGNREIGRGSGFRVDRWLYHVPRDEGGFASEFLFVNHENRPNLMMLSPYDADGAPLTFASVSVPGNQVVRVSKAALFGDAPVSHIQVLGSELCTTGIGYRAAAGESLTAHSPENSDLLFSWEIFPESASFAFDGFALVNRGEETATLTATLFDEDGAEMDTVALFAEAPLVPLAKGLLLLRDLIPEGASPSLIRFTSSQPLGVVALRGTLPGQDPAALFPIPVFTPTFQ